MEGIEKFNPSAMIRSINAAVETGSIEKEQLRGALVELLPRLSEEEINDTQRVVQDGFFILGSIHEALVQTRISRSESHQARLADPEE